MPSTPVRTNEGLQCRGGYKEAPDDKNVLSPPLYACVVLKIDYPS